MLAENNVIVRNIKGDILETEKLNWNQKLKKYLLKNLSRLRLKMKLFTELAWNPIKISPNIQLET